MISRGHGDDPRSHPESVEQDGVYEVWTLGLFLDSWRNSSDRARLVLHALIRGMTAGRVEGEHERRLAEEVAATIWSLVPVELERHPPDKLLAAFVNDFVEAAILRSHGPSATHHLLDEGGLHGETRDDFPSDSLFHSIHEIARGWVARRGLHPRLAPDLAQETLLRLINEHRRGNPVRHPLAWARRVFASLARDSTRGRADAPIPPRYGHMFLSTYLLQRKRDAPSPENEITRKDSIRHARAKIHDLPPPYREAAIVQYAHAWTRAEIGTWLQTWRPVTLERTKTIIRNTHEMLLAIGAGIEPRVRWPGRYGPARNPWFESPPPPAIFASTTTNATPPCRWSALSSDKRQADSVTHNPDIRWRRTSNEVHPQTAPWSTAGVCRQPLLAR